MAEKKRITRIEISEQMGHTWLEEYPEGWTAGTYPATRESEWPFENIVAWLEAQPKWIVIRFADPRDGHRRARAFLRKKMPVRTKKTMNWMRQQRSNGRLKFPANADLRYEY